MRLGARLGGEGSGHAVRSHQAFKALLARICELFLIDQIGRW